MVRILDLVGDTVSKTKNKYKCTRMVLRGLNQSGLARFDRTAIEGRTIGISYDETGTTQGSLLSHKARSLPTTAS